MENNTESREKTYYPEIEIDEYTDRWELKTVLRKEKDGVWYDWKFTRTVHGKHLIEDLVDPVNELHKEVYNVIIMGVVNTELVDRNGQEILQKSEIQFSEQQRLIAL